MCTVFFSYVPGLHLGGIGGKGGKCQKGGNGGHLPLLARILELVNTALCVRAILGIPHKPGPSCHGE